MILKRKAYYILISFFTISITVAGQDQKIADSLARIYKADTVKGVSKLELLRNLSFNEVNNLQLALKYAEELINLSIKSNNYLYLHRGYFQKGNKKRLFGDLEDALEAYINSGEAASKAKSISGEGAAYAAIADVYSISNNHNNAIFYYNKAISTLKQSSDSIALASTILNAGDEYLNNKIYDSALLYFKESEIIYEKSNYKIGKAYSLGNIGMVYASLGQHRLAEKNIYSAIKILEELEDYHPICEYLIYMADIYLEKSDRKTAYNYVKRSMDLAQQYGLKDQISNASLKLSQYMKVRITPQKLISTTKILSSTEIVSTILKLYKIWLTCVQILKFQKSRWKLIY
jgi:adenylate cyclase